MIILPKLIVTSADPQILRGLWYSTVPSLTKITPVGTWESPLYLTHAAYRKNGVGTYKLLRNYQAWFIQNRMMFLIFSKVTVHSCMYSDENL